MDKRDPLLNEDGNEFEDETQELPTQSSPWFGPAQQVVERYTHCADCGANLHFTHITDFSRNLTQESAKCPECGLKARHGVYKLQ